MIYLNPSSQVLITLDISLNKGPLYSPEIKQAQVLVLVLVLYITLHSIQHLLISCYY